MVVGGGGLQLEVILRNHCTWFGFEVRHLLHMFTLLYHLNIEKENVKVLGDRNIELQTRYQHG